MTGDIYINGIDIYTNYGVTPLRGAWAAILKPVAFKTPLTSEFDTKNGEDFYFTENPPVKARSFTMPFALVASDAIDFFSKKAAFQTFLTNSLFVVSSPKLDDTYTCYLEECTQYKQIETIMNSRVSAVLHLKLREINPKNR